MKTLINSVLVLTLGLTAVTISLNSEVACAILAAAGILIIAMNDYGARRASSSGLAV